MVISYTVNNTNNTNVHRTTAHEIGHNVNASDNPPTIACGCYLMPDTVAAFLNSTIMCNNSPGYKLSFCDASINEIAPFLYNNRHLLGIEHPDFYITMNLTDKLYYLCSFCCDFIPLDTIYYEDKNGIAICLPDTGDYHIYFPTKIAPSIAYYFTVNREFLGMQMQTIIRNGITYYYFPLSNYSHLWSNTNEDYIIVKAEIYNYYGKSNEFVFKFRVSSNQQVADAFSSININFLQ